MLAHALAALAMTLAVMPVPPPAASPSPAPSATPALKTIATVHASARCAAIITHANSAIATTLDNDQVIATTITKLRYTNYDSDNAMHHYQALNALGDLAGKLMTQARAGDDQVKRLRKLASETKDPQKAKALKSFADQLGGALWKQQKLARDLNGFLAYQDFRDAAKFDDSSRAMNQAVYGVSDPFARQPAGPVRSIDPASEGLPAPIAMGHDPNEATATQQAKAAADDFENRIPAILNDENLAAGKVDAAISGC